MKYLILLMVALCFLVQPGFLVQPALGQDWAKKMFKDFDHDFGTVLAGASTKYEFVFENPYKEDVLISGVRSSCGCTTVSVKNNNLKSWEKGAIVAVFNTDRFRGNRNATITVSIVKPYRAEVQLRVKGNIRGDITLSPLAFDFGQVQLPSENRKSIRITKFGNGNWQIRDLRSTYGHVKIRLNQISRGFDSVVYDLEARILDTAPEGFMKEEIIVLTNDRNNEQFSIPISGKIVSGVQMSPSLLALGTKTNANAKKKVLLKSSEPFEIIDVACANSNYTVTAPSGAKKIHFLEVAFQAGEEVGEFRDELIIKTSVNTMKLPTIVKISD